MIQRADIVLDVGFGDGGKGKAVDHLCSTSKCNPIVVRFSGGQQAGHTVVNHHGRHVHSSFPSGTLRGNRGYITEHCTISPTHLMNEYQVIKEKRDLSIHLTIHPMAHLTTPADIAYGRVLEKRNQHGSCGKGVGATMARNFQTPYKFYAINMKNFWVLNYKLVELLRYYESQLAGSESLLFKEYFNEVSAGWVADIRRLLEVVRIRELDFKNQNWDHVIFEGSQGILLDMDYGIFPHVTYANTTSRNIPFDCINVASTHYVTRTYLTRHGDGPMPSWKPMPEIVDDTNGHNEWQGHLRKGDLDWDLISYAMDVDQLHNKSHLYSLLISHWDQMQVTPPRMVTDRLDLIMKSSTKEGIYQ